MMLRSLESKGNGYMKKILVVDNHPVMLKFMSNLLEKNGHQVLTACDGLSALEILNTVTPDIMFVDLIMPNISGDKLCRIIRSRPELKDVFLVILSAIAAEEKPCLTDYGADACIAKGPCNKMAAHVLTVLKSSDSGRPKYPMEKIIGKETIYGREITKELLASKKHFETTLNNISEGILGLTPALKIVYINPAALSIIGTSEESILSTKFLKLFHEKQQRIVASLIKEVCETKQTMDHNTPLELNDKQVIFNIIPVENDNSISILVILKDVTRRKQMEAQLYHAQRMEAIGTLSSGVAHEINNPINGVIGYAEILRDRYQELDLDEDIPDRIIKEADRIAEIVKNLLSFARDRQEEKSTSHVKDILSNTLGLIERRIVKDGIKLSVNIIDGLPIIQVRSHEIQQVFLNILSNAHDALRERISNFKEKDHILEITSETIDVESLRYVRITFYDNGSGIHENILNKICDPFFSTKPPGKGTGLGLSISHSIIKNHGGRLLFDSVEGEYTKTMVDLPVRQQDKN